MKTFLAIIFIISLTTAAQEKDPDRILDNVVKEFSKIKDYSVKVNVKMDVPFIKAPDTEATIYYKQPDKIHFESDGFAMLPKEGLDFSPIGLLKSDYTALYIKDEDYNGQEHSVIRIIPTEDRGDIILSTLWINTRDRNISRVEASTKVSGTFIMELFYNNDLKYPLPSSMIFHFTFTGMPGKRGKSASRDEGDKKDENITGKVYINYSDYQVNKGIPDSVFEQKKKN
jgi:outer membrane lipoprotein-sorting protein